MMKKYESIWDGLLSKITVAKNRFVLNPKSLLPVHSALYRVGSKRTHFEHETVTCTEIAGFVKPAVLQRAHPSSSFQRKQMPLVLFLLTSFECSLIE